MTDEKNKKSEIELQGYEVSPTQGNEVSPIVNETVIEPEVVVVLDRRDPETAARVKRLSAIGLNQTATAIAAQISHAELRKYYIADYNAGQASMQEVVATAAMEQVMAGNPQMIQFMAKTKLGWNETNIVEHIGEVRAVVSAVPLTKEEFAQRYLEQKEEEE